MGGSVMRRSKMMVRLCIGVAAGSALGLVALEAPVSAAPVTLEDFEDNAEFDPPSDWDVIQERVVLGETELAGDCTSPESSNYTNLPNLLERGFLWGPEREGATPTFGTIGTASHVPYSYFTEWFAPGESSQYLIGGTLPVWWYDRDYGFAVNGGWDDYPEAFFTLNSTQRLELLNLQALHLNDDVEEPQWPYYEDRYDVAVLDGEGYGIDREGKVLQLYSWTDSYAGHVIHGPAVVSRNTLTVDGEATVSFWFRASADMDNYHVYGYLQNVDDCDDQIELFDATGQSMQWTQITKTVTTTTASEYRFVFVSGTYDESYGGMAGSLLWIDGIACDGSIGGTCTTTVVTEQECGDDCLGIVGPGLDLDEIELLPDDTPSRRTIQWVQDALAAEAVDELPSTGSNTQLLSLGGALLVLGFGVFVLRRRQAATTSPR